MERRRMGSSGVSVSALTLGTMTFGAESPAEESLAMLDTYVEAGGNVIDTADVVVLDDERRAAMVSNLLVVLCGDSRATPIVNTGSLYQ